MTQTTPPASAARPRFVKIAALPWRFLAHLAAAPLLTAFGLALVYAAVRAWRMLRDQPTAQTDLCIALIIAGLGAAIAFGGAMQFLDAPLDWPDRPRWPARGILKILKRFLMLAQLAAMLPAVAAAAVLLFGDPLIKWSLTHMPFLKSLSNF